LHQKPNRLSQKEGKQLDVGEEDCQLYDFGFAQIPTHIMSRVSMWDSLLMTEQKRKKHSFPKSFFHSWFLWNV
jgi:hypothetical protein